MPPLRPLPLVRNRSLHTSAARQAGSPFFVLHKLSNSRETQHLNKLSRLQRADHSPALKIIESSEVDPWGGVKPGDGAKSTGSGSDDGGKVTGPTEVGGKDGDAQAGATVSDSTTETTVQKRSLGRKREGPQSIDAAALAVGRAFLAREEKLRKALEQMKKKLEQEKEVSNELREELQQEDEYLQDQLVRARTHTRVWQTIAAVLGFALIFEIGLEYNDYNKRRAEEIPPRRWSNAAAPESVAAQSIVSGQIAPPAPATEPVPINSLRHSAGHYREPWSRWWKSWLWKQA